MDLQSWAIKNKIWEPKSWETYLNQLIDVYTQAVTFKKFHEWLKETFNEKSIYALSDELKDPARMCISGGGLEENAFGRLMFEKFGLGVKYCESYEQSLEEYRKYGDWIEINVRNIIVGLENYDTFLKELKSAIEHFSKVLNIKFVEPVINENFVAWVRYPNPKLTEKLNEFLNALAGVLEFTNYYTMFVRYFRTTSIAILLNYLGCDAEGIKNIRALFGVKEVFNANMDIVDLDNSKPYELFWLDGENSGRIIYLFGYWGFANYILCNFVKDVSSQQSQFWLDRIESLKKLRKSGDWELHDAICDLLKVVFSFRNAGYRSSILVKLSDGRVSEISADLLMENRWYIIYDYYFRRYNVEKPVTAYKYNYFKYTFGEDETVNVTMFLEQIFPLLALGFLRYYVRDLKNKTIRFEANDPPHLDKLISEVLTNAET